MPPPRGDATGGAHDGMAVWQPSDGDAGARLPAFSGGAFAREGSPDALLDALGLTSLYPDPTTPTPPPTDESPPARNDESSEASERSSTTKGHLRHGHRVRGISLLDRWIEPGSRAVKQVRTGLGSAPARSASS